MSASQSDSAPRQITSVRVFDWPVEQVFSAWMDAETLAQWWGPKGFANTFFQCDMRPGGNWTFVMHGPNGAEYVNQSVFVEIIPNQRIVIDHVCAPKFRLTASFEDLGGKTKLVFCQLFETAELCQKMKSLAVPSNEENFDRLAAVLPRLSAGNREIVMTRHYAAPKTRVWQAWTRPDELAQWFGPSGFSLTTLAHDLRPGGHWRWVFRGPDGSEYKNHIHYVDVVDCQRLVYWHGDDGQGAQPPFHVTILFAAQDNQTVVTMRAMFASAEERAKMLGLGAIEGGQQTLDRLAAFLEKS